MSCNVHLLDRITVHQTMTGGSIFLSCPVFDLLHKNSALTVESVVMVVHPRPLLFTGDINYQLRFHKTDKGWVVEDLQNNNVTMSKPVVVNGASIIVIDRVLMSGELVLSCVFDRH